MTLTNDLDEAPARNTERRTSPALLLPVIPFALIQESIFDRAQQFLPVSAVAVVSHMEGKPMPGFLIRKEAKTHGRMKQIEGMEKGIDKVVIVDEVCTTGKATQEAIDAAVREGYTVVAVISLVDRKEGGSQQLRSKYKYYSVFTASELLANDHDQRPADSTRKLSQPARSETALHK